MKKIFFTSIILFYISPLFSQNDIEPVYTGSFGSVTINNQVYNQFSLRPELAFGKIGLGLDLYFYFDQDGNLYEENWNFSSTKDAYKTLVDKIYYLRWGLPYDDMYFRIGALPNITLGNGSLVKGYSNVMDYPRVRRAGFNFKYKFQNFRLQFIHSDLKEFKEPGVIGLQGTFEYIKNLDFHFNLVTDINQKKGLLDSDGDGYPDFIEPGFENNPDQWHQNQVIQEWLNNNCDDCDNLIDMAGQQMQEYLDSSKLEKDEVSGISIGTTYTLNDKLKIYSELSQLIGETSNPNNSLSFNTDLGYGVIPLGLKASWEKVNMSIDYRFSSKNYLFNFWDQNYDHNRAMVIYDDDNENPEVITKESTLYRYGKLKGANITISSNFIRIFQLTMSYQHLNGEKWDDDLLDYKTDKNSTFYTKLDIDTSKISKVRIAELFYQQSYSSKPFSFNPDENTLFGYNIGVEMADNMILLLRGRKSYVLDEGTYRPVKTTQVETQIIF